MKNWSLENIHIGSFVIPESCKVYAHPGAACAAVVQISCRIGPDGTKFGVAAPLSTGHYREAGSASELVGMLNIMDARIMEREEVRFLLLYSSQENFKLPAVPASDRQVTPIINL